MASHSPSNASGTFTLSRNKITLVVSLIITWWFAAAIPHYRPVIESRLDEARQKIPSIKIDWHAPIDDPRDAYNRSKLALMIEPRPLPHLVPQILHMISVVPPDWRFLFIGSNLSVVSVGRAYATKHQQVIGKLDLLELPEPWEIDSKEKTSRLLTDIRFYNEFLPEVEWLLKFESDSILCANSGSSLNEWLQWTWAGAPSSPDDQFSFNGGLSLRRVSDIKRVLGFQARYNDSEPEDSWFSKRLYVMPGTKVATGVSGALAVEDVYFPNSMGFHVRDGGAELAEDVWKDRNRRLEIFDYCPELSLIMDMKLERERCEGDDGEGGLHPVGDEFLAQHREGLGEGGEEGETETGGENESEGETSALPSDSPSEADVAS